MTRSPDHTPDHPPAHHRSLLRTAAVLGTAVLAAAGAPTAAGADAGGPPPNALIAYTLFGLPDEDLMDMGLVRPDGSSLDTGSVRGAASQVLWGAGDDLLTIGIFEDSDAAGAPPLRILDVETMELGEEYRPSAFAHNVLAWSPDGGELLYADFVPKRSLYLKVWDRAADERRDLDSAGGSAWNWEWDEGAWDPEGQGYFLIHASDPEAGRLTLMSPGGEREAEIRAFDRPVHDLVVTDDGERLLLTMEDGGDTVGISMDRDGGSVDEVFRYGGVVDELDWSSDGRWVVFSEGPNVYTARVEPELVPEEVTTAPRDIDHLDWAA
ncbi:WD40 repeat domain-containing protein [Nocardiopsis sp. RSe5-2]|uniref:WD40 repeat domain-containing protein n=1 Tax=Nocardiopsis endophytica TaxID=3018445 RepID=A0ABT4TZJ1_9ACTN|nr:WD40 repeat domain-containing protein [Nocardiopsis endophytica]MDA2810122.1 WD40 repeat domain-containing protein [Nocardiopsis endophytica]